MKYLIKFKKFESKGEVKTWGGLKALIKSLINKKKLVAAKSGAINILSDQLVGLIPGAGNIKSAFDFFKNIYDATDDKKTNSWLDKLNVDDKYSKIVDDSIENQFIKYLSNYIESKKDDEILPDDFDINKELSKYLSKNFSNRTLTITNERRKSEYYKGKKIPGKYLAGPHPGKMKKEIDRFRGKSEYKKNWDADYKSGKGGKGKRVKTKKSKATKAYQKMFGNK